MKGKVKESIKISWEINIKKKELKIRENVKNEWIMWQLTQLNSKMVKS